MCKSSKNDLDSIYIKKINEDNYLNESNNELNEKNVNKKLKLDNLSIINLEINFSIFIQSLLQQSFMALGLIPWPDSRNINVKLSIAREIIEILEMLQKKTINNLNEKENTLLGESLYKLRIAYIKKNKKK
jgi:hypothetical protein